MSRLHTGNMPVYGSTRPRASPNQRKAAATVNERPQPHDREPQSSPRLRHSRHPRGRHHPPRLRGQEHSGRQVLPRRGLRPRRGRGVKASVKKSVTAAASPTPNPRRSSAHPERPRSPSPPSPRPPRSTARSSPASISTPSTSPEYPPAGPSGSGPSIADATRTLLAHTRDGQTRPAPLRPKA